MTTHRVMRSVVMAAAAVAWLLAAGEGHAAIPGTNGVYTGCYQKSAQTIRVIDAETGETCNPNEVRITWNQSGPPGPVGPQGEAGPVGPKGDKGDPGGTLKADGPCFNDNENRYQDCGNGTVTDTVTGLIWLKQANCLPNDFWAEANNAAASLADGMCELTDNSSPGDWRLPTNQEWSDTVARATQMHCTGDTGPSLTNTVGTDCYIEGPPPFTGVEATMYWSSSVSEVDGRFGGVVSLSGGFVGTVGKTGFERAVWPVRSSR